MSKYEARPSRPHDLQKIAVLERSLDEAEVRLRYVLERLDLLKVLGSESNPSMH